MIEQLLPGLPGVAPPEPEQPDISNMTWAALGNAARYGFHHSAVNYKGNLYWIGGYTGSTPIRNFDRYDRVAKNWVAMPSLLPAGRLGHNSLVVGDYLYVLGGATGNTTTAIQVFSRYDFLTGQWDTLANLPIGLVHGDACHVNGKIYIFGGKVNSSADETPASFPSYEYDIATNTWRNLNLPISGRLDIGVSVYKDKIYILGGRRSNVYLAELYEYDPATGILTNKQPPPAAIGCRQAFINYKGWLIAVFGMLNGLSTANPTPYRYHPVENRWEAFPTRSDIQRAFGGVCIDGNNIVYFSGINTPTGLSDTIVLRPPA